MLSGKLLKDIFRISWSSGKQQGITEAISFPKAKSEDTQCATHIATVGKLV